jgi:hypothetical protein
VGKHKRAPSGGGFGVVPSSPGLSSGRFFNHSGGGSKGVVPPPLTYSLPPLPASVSQLSLRLAEASGSSYSHHHQHQQQPLNHPNSHFTSRRIVSALSGHSEASSVFPSGAASGSPSFAYKRDQSRHHLTSRLLVPPVSASRKYAPSVRLSYFEINVSRNSTTVLVFFSLCFACSLAL